MGPLTGLMQHLLWGDPERTNVLLGLIIEGNNFNNICTDDTVLIAGPERKLQEVLEKVINENEKETTKHQL